MTPSAAVLLWDIETTNLKASFGHILCVGYKWLGDKKIHIISAADNPQFLQSLGDDKWLLKQFAPVLKSADMWVTWNGKRFDVPFVQTRMLVHDLGPLPPVRHDDTLYTSRHKLRLHSNRLDSVAEFFNLSPKTPIRGEDWRRGAYGHKPSLRYIADHCRADVQTLEDAYLKLRSLNTRHPNVRLIGSGDTDGCPVCGSDKLQKRGRQFSRLQEYQRYQCTACGAWSYGPMLKEGGIH